VLHQKSLWIFFSGEVLGVLGENGAGKSHLASKIISGIYTKTTGSIRLMAVEVFYSICVLMQKRLGIAMDPTRVQFDQQPKWFWENIFLWPTKLKRVFTQ